MNADDLTKTWRDAQARLPEGWTLESLRCASTGLQHDQRSGDWVAVATNDVGETRQHRGADPTAALEGLPAIFEEVPTPGERRR